MMEVNKYPSIEPVSQRMMMSESEEGGLNLIDFKDKVIRQIHVVAGITFVISSFTFFKAINRVPNYQAGFEILSEPVTIETKVTSSGSQSRETTEEITAVTLNEVQIKTLKSPEIVMSVVKELENKYPGINYNLIVSGLTLTPNEEETILEVVYKNSDREQVYDILESLKTTYLNYSLTRRQLGVNRGLEFLDRQIPTIEAKVEEFNQELQQLRTAYNFIDPKIQGTQISERIDNLIAQQIDKKTQLEKTQKIANLAINELERQSTTSTTAMQAGTSRYNELLKNLNEIDSKIAQKSAIFSEQSFEMQTLREQKQSIISLINRERATIEQKLNNQVQLEQKQLESINQEIKSMQADLQEWSGVTREYENIDRQITITVEQLNELLIQREALRLEASQKEAPWRLLTPVGEPQTDAASTANYIILGSFFGFLVGIGVALILDQYQNLIYNSNQVKEITNQPILGIIPYDNSKKQLFLTRIVDLIKPLKLSESKEKSSAIQIHQNSSSLTQLLSSSREAFRFLGANISLFEVENNQNINSVMITSAKSGEGKSTVALHLAQARAAMGTKVLVVEADLRSSNQLSGAMTLEKPQQGLSDLLLSDTLTAKDVIQPSYKEENLFVLPAGKINNNLDSSKLLASPKMRKLMERLAQNFELVIYDVAPVIDYADVSLLSSKTDGVILVTGLGKLQALKLKEAMNQLNISRIPVLGVVINKITPHV
jgi:polysaccharide biosynthesis transport protein